MKNNSSNHIHFLIYRNRFNEVKAYEVELGDVFEGKVKVFDLREGKAKTFIKENIHSVYLNFASAFNAAKLVQSDYPLIPRSGPHKLTLEEYKKRYNEAGKLEVCFTGFSKTRKKELSEIADLNDMFVRPSVTNGLSFLVCGSNTGPSKLKKAEAAGVKVMTEDEWLELIG